MKYIIFIVLLINDLGDCVIYRLNDTEYLKMPPVYHLEDYESCVHVTNGTYCYFPLDLVSDTPSDLLQMIIDYSEHTSNHFNHTRIHRGVCLTRTCKHFLQHDKVMDPRLILERCLNESIWRDYKLKTRLSYTIFCKKIDDPMVINAGDVAAAVFFVSLGLLNLIGSLYDFCFVKGNKGHRLLISFSIKRNFEKLMAQNKDPLRERLQGIYGIRAMSVMLVILGHAPLPFVMNTENPHEFEQTYYNVVFQLFYNGTIIIQSFFVMAGCLIAYNIRAYFKKNERTWILIPKGIFIRWLRLTPAYAVVLIFTLTWIRFVASGPLWETAVGVEVADCRRDGWLNMVYLNNYIDNSQCMAQTWYLAADMQLYTLSLFVCVLAKSARSRKIVLSTLFLIGVMIPAIHTYFQDLDAVMIISPEMTRNLFVSYPTFNHSYKRGHSNIPSIVIGLAVGNLVYKGLRDEREAAKYKNLGILYYLTIPLGVVIILSGMIFYGDRPKLSIYLRVVIAALLRPLFSLLGGIFAIGMVFKFENLYRKIVEWNGWRTPARVSYSAYLIHVTIIRIFAGMNTTLLRISLAQCLKDAFGIILITFLIAYPFWLLVEAPLNQAVLIILRLSKEVKQDDENNKIDAPKKSVDHGTIEPENKENLGISIRL